MITSFLQLNYSLAVITPLPALLLGHLNQTGSVIILGTLPSGVILAAATYTYFGAAPTTPGVLSSSGHINLDFVWLNPLAAAFCRAIEVLCRRILFKLLVPKPLELIIE